MILLLAGVAAAGPWVHAPGAAYTKVAYSMYAAGEEIRFRSGSLSAYTEVGVLPGVEVVAELPYTWSSNAFDDSVLRYRTSGLGTARLGLGVHPPVDWPVALHLLGRVPLSGSTDRVLYDPRLGDAQVDLDLLVSAGGSPAVGSQRIWALVEGGLRHRTNLRPVAGIGRPGNDVLYRGQVGFLPGQLGWVQLEARGLADLLGGLAAHELGGGVAVAVVAGFHVEAGVGWVYAARGAPTGVGGSLGVSYVLRAAHEG